jgi:small-conductance mechanosensitive channel
MTRGFDRKQLDDLVVALTQPSAAAELAVIAVCLLAAWLLVRLLRGAPRPPGASVLFGDRVVDGVLFPLLALAFAFGARIGLEPAIQPAVFRVAIPVLLTLVMIRLSARVLQRTLPEAPWVRVLERSISWLAWIAVALWVSGVLPAILAAMDDVAWDVGSLHMTLRKVVEGTITAGIVLVLALWISSAFEKRLLGNAIGQDLSLRKIAATLVRAVLLAVGLMVALSALGIDLTALSFLGGAIGVGLGFGLQKIAANYVSGFVILAERRIQIGDMVKVDNFEGRITDIRTRYTAIRALNGREAILPNETLITSRVENLSHGDPRVLVQTSVVVAYGTDVRTLQPRIAAVVAAVPRVVAEPAPVAQLANLSPDGIELVVNFWIADSQNGQGNVKSEVNLALLDLLRAEKAEVPPQRVVHAVVSRLAAARGDEGSRPVGAAPTGAARGDPLPP